MEYTSIQKLFRKNEGKPIWLYSSSSLFKENPLAHLIYGVVKKSRRISEYKTITWDGHRFGHGRIQATHYKIWREATIEESARIPSDDMPSQLQRALRVPVKVKPIERMKTDQPFPIEAKVEEKQIRRHGNITKSVIDNKLMQTELSLLTKMTSREIADLTGKQHKDVMKSIRIMEPAWEKVAGRKFALGDYHDENQQLRPEYHLSKRECLYIATKFNDEARAKLILRWERLETTKPDFSDPNVVLQLAQNWKEEQEKRVMAEIKARDEKTRADSYKASYRKYRKKCHSIEDKVQRLSSYEDYKITDISKDLDKCKPKLLNDWLVGQEFQHKKNGRYHLTDKYENCGYESERPLSRKPTEKFMVFTELGYELICGGWIVNNIESVHDEIQANRRIKRR